MLISQLTSSNCQLRASKPAAPVTQPVRPSKKWKRKELFKWTTTKIVWWLIPACLSFFLHPGWRPSNKRMCHPEWIPESPLEFWGGGIANQTHPVPRSQLEGKLCTSKTFITLFQCTLMKIVWWLIGFWGVGVGWQTKPTRFLVSWKESLLPATLS